jgi:hypothetical protein
MQPAKNGNCLVISAFSHVEPTRILPDMRLLKGFLDEPLPSDAFTQMIQGGPDTVALTEDGAQFWVS